ncbi:unnamed protein product [Spirodela intermedia]|uniref:Serine hydrolase domain-containing protein n=1 Tax=Spirodela intermedia TaxID=51605 RepID=A0A7I8KKK8_SPIIN|nr:unnamed protein product [Spirodela intermedia]
MVEALEQKAAGGPRKKKKMKILCLHGFRTSGSFLRKQISRWDPSIFSSFDLVFPDGIFPAGGKSDIERIFPPPYFEWFQFNKEFTEYENLDACISFLCEYIATNGPFDGYLGFSQGATIAALLLGYQAKGKILQEQPPVKLFVSISGSKFRDPAICEAAYGKPIEVNSVHLIGDEDWLKLPSEDLVTAFVDPLIIRHPYGHIVPRLDAAAVVQLSEWTRGIAGGAAAENGAAAGGYDPGEPLPLKDTAALAPPSERTPPEVPPAENGGAGGGGDEGGPAPSKGTAAVEIAGGVAAANGAAGKE